MAEISPFAGNGAGRAGKTAAGFPCEKIGEVEKLPGSGERFRLVFLQPQQLRRFHLGRNGAANKVKYLGVGRVDPLCLFDSAMIHPDNDVARRIV